MSFRITPEDVGRMARAKNGMAYMVFKGGSDSYPYMTDKGACTSEGKLYYSDGTWGDDLIAWAEESANDQDADQVTDQDRPKDLRDEFAMSVAGHIWNRNADMFIGGAIQFTADTAYAVADAMMKARGK